MTALLCQRAPWDKAALNPAHDAAPECGGSELSQKKLNKYIFKKTTAMGWSRSGCFALRSQTLLRMWIAATTCISEAIWKRSTGKDATSIIRELNLLYAVTCVPAEEKKHCNADSSVKEGGCRAHLPQDRRGSLPDSVWIHTNVAPY